VGSGGKGREGDRRLVMAHGPQWGALLALEVEHFPGHDPLQRDRADGQIDARLELPHVREARKSPDVGAIVYSVPGRKTLKHFQGNL